MSALVARLADRLDRALGLAASRPLREARDLPCSMFSYMIFGWPSGR